MKNPKTLLLSLAAVAALALGGSALAGAASNSTSSTPQQNASQLQSQDPGGRDGDHDGRGGHDSGRGGHGGPNETALTGDTAAKVKAAALDKVPGGTVERVETSEGGVYEAHVTKKDGSEVVVQVDKSFNVTATEQMGG